PVSNHGLPPSEMPIQGTLPSWLSVPQAMGAPLSVQNSHASGGSLRKSSSTTPDQDSKSSRGTSSDETKSQSSKSGEPTRKGVQSLARFPSVNMAEGHILSTSEVSASHKPQSTQIRDVVEKTPCASVQSEFEMPSSKISQEKPLESPSKKSSHFVSDLNEKKQISSSHGVPEHNSGGQTKQTAHNFTHEKSDQDGKSNLKPARSCSQSGNGLLQTLHRVTTTGVGPKGITISGILSYSSNQVRIVCVCHGTQMSPAEFVQHAGSTDISNPERNIVVTPMPVTIPVTSAQG
ncbi:hypothetical protein KI387_043444, partial [Taxus chinensis]